MGLTAQFLLGMAVNLLGQPSQATGGARIASTVFLAAHAIIALGMVISAVLTVQAAARIGGPWHRQAIWGAAAIAATVTAGILTVITKSNWWSYGMALGFIAWVFTHGGLLFKTAPPSPRPKNQTETSVSDPGPIPARGTVSGLACRSTLIRSDAVGRPYLGRCRPDRTAVLASSRLSCFLPHQHRVACAASSQA